MERNVNYVMVGVIVLMTLAGIAVFASWVIGGLDQNRYKYYTVIFTNAVSGLNINSPVEYKGVRVGQVTDIVLDPLRPNIVQVNMKVKEKTPVQSYTDVSLGIQSITGLSRIELDTPLGEHEPPEKIAEFPYPVLQGNSRQLGKLLEDLPEIAAKILSISQKIDATLDEQTIKDIRASSHNVRELSEELKKLMSDKNIQRIEHILDNAETASEDFAKVGEKVTRTAEEIEVLANKLGDAVESGQEEFGTLTRKSVDQILGLVQDGRKMASEIRDLADALEENPSQLLYQPKSNAVEVAP